MDNQLLGSQPNILQPDQLTAAANTSDSDCGCGCGGTGKCADHNHKGGSYYLQESYFCLNFDVVIFVIFLAILYYFIENKIVSMLILFLLAFAAFLSYRTHTKQQESNPVTQPTT